MLTEYVTTSISRKVKSLLEALKLHCHSEPIVPKENEIHLLNGVLRTDGTWLPEKRFCTNRLNIEYHPEMDEATPHMHVAFIPVINGKDRKGNPCKRINCSEFWKVRDSYSRLQDEYHDFITSRGYDLERGEKGSTTEHLSVAEYKLKKAEEQLAATTEQLAEIKNIEEIKTTNLPLNTVAIKKDDFEMLFAAAKNYVGAKNAESENVQLKAECLSLKSENEELKSERDNLSGQIYQLEYEYGRFYENVADEVVLQQENERLKAENDRIGCQVHTLSNEVMTLKQERYELEKKIEDKDNELTQTKSLLKALQEKFDRIMEFIRNHSLKEKLEEFLKPVVKHKLR